MSELENEAAAAGWCAEICRQAVALRRSRLRRERGQPRAPLEGHPPDRPSFFSVRATGGVEIRKEQSLAGVGTALYRPSGPRQWRPRYRPSWCRRQGRRAEMPCGARPTAVNDVPYAKPAAESATPVGRRPSARTVAIADVASSSQERVRLTLAPPVGGRFRINPTVGFASRVENDAKLPLVSAEFFCPGRGV